MVWYETLIGSFFEILTLLFIMNIFNSKYSGSIYKALFISFIIALIIVATDRLWVPIGYVINYSAMIIIISLFLRINIIEVFFEFLFSAATILLLQSILIYIFALSTNHKLTLVEIAIQLTLVLLVSIYIGRSRKLQLLIRPFYYKYKKQTYFISGNLFVLSIISLYVWDVDIQFFYKNITLITILTLAWFLINGYLLKKLINDYKQKKIILLHEKNIKLSQHLSNTLSAVKSENQETPIIFNESYEEGKMILLTTDQGEYLINPQNLYYAVQKQNHCLLCLENLSIRLYGINLIEIIECINKENFLRCNKSYAVNIEKISGVNKINNKTWQATLINRQETIDLKIKYCSNFLINLDKLSKEGYR